MSAIPNLSLALTLPSLGRSGRDVAPYLTPEEEQSVLGKMGGMGFSALMGGASVLDFMGANVRGAINMGMGGRYGNPWSISESVTGRDILRTAGLAGRRDNWGNALGGFAVEMATDPLTYMSFGTTSAAKKGGGEIAKRIGILDKLTNVQASKNGLDEGIRLATAGNSGWAFRLRQEAADAAHSLGLDINDYLKPHKLDEYGKTVAGSKKVAGLKADDVLSGTIGLHLNPFGKATWQTNLPGTAETFDFISHKLRHGTIPFTNISPGETFASLFKTVMRGRTTGPMQDAMQRHIPGLDAETAGILSDSYDELATLDHKAFQKLVTEDGVPLGQRLRNLAEYTGPGMKEDILDRYADPEGIAKLFEANNIKDPEQIKLLKPIIERWHKSVKDVRQIQRDLGLDAAELLDPSILYGASRQQIVEIGGVVKGSGKALPMSAEEDLTRLTQLTGVGPTMGDGVHAAQPGGTGSLNAMFEDHTLWKMARDTKAGPDEAAQYINSKWLHHTDAAASAAEEMIMKVRKALDDAGTTKADNVEIDKILKKLGYDPGEFAAATAKWDQAHDLVKFIQNLDETFSKNKISYYSTKIVDDIARSLISGRNKIANARAIYSAFGESAVAGEAKDGHIPILEALKRAKITGGARYARLSEEFYRIARRNGSDYRISEETGNILRAGDGEVVAMMSKEMKAQVKQAMDGGSPPPPKPPGGGPTPPPKPHFPGGPPPKPHGPGPKPPGHTPKPSSNPGVNPAAPVSPTFAGPHPTAPPVTTPPPPHAPKGPAAAMGPAPAAPVAPMPFGDALPPSGGKPASPTGPIAGGGPPAPTAPAPPFFTPIDPLDFAIKSPNPGGVKKPGVGGATPPVSPGSSVKPKNPWVPSPKPKVPDVKPAAPKPHVVDPKNPWVSAAGGGVEAVPGFTLKLPKGPKGPMVFNPIHPTSNNTPFKIIRPLEGNPPKYQSHTIQGRLQGYGRFADDIPLNYYLQGGILGKPAEARQAYLHAILVRIGKASDVAGNTAVEKDALVQVARNAPVPWLPFKFDDVIRSFKEVEDGMTRMYLQLPKGHGLTVKQRLQWIKSIGKDGYTLPTDNFLLTKPVKGAKGGYGLAVDVPTALLEEANKAYFKVEKFMFAGLYPAERASALTVLNSNLAGGAYDALLPSIQREGFTEGAEASIALKKSMPFAKQEMDELDIWTFLSGEDLPNKAGKLRDGGQIDEISYKYGYGANMQKKNPKAVVGRDEFRALSEHHLRWDDWWETLRVQGGLNRQDIDLLRVVFAQANEEGMIRFGLIRHDELPVFAKQHFDEGNFPAVEAVDVIDGDPNTRGMATRQHVEGGTLDPRVSNDPLTRMFSDDGTHALSKLHMVQRLQLQKGLGDQAVNTLLHEMWHIVEAKMPPNIKKEFMGLMDELHHTGELQKYLHKHHGVSQGHYYSHSADVIPNYEELWAQLGADSTIRTKIPQGALRSLMYGMNNYIVQFMTRIKKLVGLPPSMEARLDEIFDLAGGFKEGLDGSGNTFGGTWKFTDDPSYKPGMKRPSPSARQKAWDDWKGRKPVFGYKDKGRGRNRGRKFPKPKLPRQSFSKVVTDAEKMATGSMWGKYSKNDVRNPKSPRYGQASGPAEQILFAGRMVDPSDKQTIRKIFESTKHHVDELEATLKSMREARAAGQTADEWHSIHKRDQPPGKGWDFWIKQQEGYIRNAAESPTAKAIGYVHGQTEPSMAGMRPRPAGKPDDVWLGQHRYDPTDAADRVTLFREAQYNVEKVGNVLDNMRKGQGSGKFKAPSDWFASNGYMFEPESMGGFTAEQFAGKNWDEAAEMLDGLMDEAASSEAGKAVDYVRGQSEVSPQFPPHWIDDVETMRSAGDDIDSRMVDDADMPEDIDPITGEPVEYEGGDYDPVSGEPIADEGDGWDYFDEYGNPEPKDPNYEYYEADAPPPHPADADNGPLDGDFDPQPGEADFDGVKVSKVLQNGGVTQGYDEILQEIAENIDPKGLGRDMRRSPKDKRYIAARKEMQDMLIDEEQAAKMAGMMKRYRSAIDESFGNLQVPESVVEDAVGLMDKMNSPKALIPLMKAFDTYTNIFKTNVTSPFMSFLARNFTSLFWQDAVAGGIEDIPGMIHAWGNARPFVQGGIVKGASKYGLFRGRKWDTAKEAGTPDKQATDQLRRLFAANKVSPKLVGEAQDMLALDGFDVPTSMLEELLGVPGGASPSIMGIRHKDGSFSEGALQKLFAPFRRAKEAVPATATTPAKEAVEAGKLSNIINFLNVRGGWGPAREGAGEGFSIAAAGTHMNTLAEDVGRAATWLRKIKRGYSPHQAAIESKLAHVDFGDLTGFERKYMKRIVPWYSYSRHMIPEQLKMIGRKPSSSLPAMAIRATTADGHQTPDQAMGSIPWGEEKDGRQKYISLDLPHEILNDLMAFKPTMLGTAQATGKKLLSQIHPAFKFGLEITNDQVYFRPDARGMTGQFSHVNHLSGGKWNDTILNHAIMSSPLSRGISTAVGLQSEYKTPAEKAVNLLSGVRVQSVDMGAARDRAFTSSATELMKDMGGRTLDNVYLPKHIQAGLTPEETKKYELLKSVLRSASKSAKDRAKARREKEEGALGVHTPGV